MLPQVQKWTAGEGLGITFSGLANIFPGLRLMARELQSVPESQPLAPLRKQRPFPTAAAGGVGETGLPPPAPPGLCAALRGTLNAGGGSEKPGLWGRVS